MSTMGSIKRTNYTIFIVFSPMIPFPTRAIPMEASQWLASQSLCTRELVFSLAICSEMADYEVIYW